MPVNNKRALTWSSDSEDSASPPAKTLSVRKENIMRQKGKEKNGRSVVMNGNVDVSVNGISMEASMNPVVVLSRDTVSNALKRKSLGMSVAREQGNERSEDEEKRQRHHNRIAAQRRSFHSPALATPGRKSMAYSMPHLNQEGLQNLYKVCIKLSAANKISQKNAFGLHLIDYMSDLLKENKEGHMNFKLASSALDAGAKIYCNRVDCVHAEAQKVASGLVMATDNKKGEAGMMEEENEYDVEQDIESALSEPKPKKKKTMKRKNTVTVAENPESLNVKKIESNIEIDPVFHHLNSTYDVGNVCGLLMVNLKVNSHSLLMLDSNASLEDEISETQQDAPQVNIECFSSCLQEIIKSHSTVCSKFSNFEFLNRDGANDFMPIEEEPHNEEFYFNIDDEVEDIQDENGDCINDDNFDDDDNSDNEQDIDRTLHKSLAKGISMIAVNDLANLLSSKPSDYSYFNSKLLGTWAGPNHWKKVPWLRGNRKLDGESKKRQRKIYDEINFFEVNDDENANAVGKKELKLQISTLQKWHQNYNDLQLPQDHGFDPSKIGRSFSKPDDFFHCAKSNEEVLEASMENDNMACDSPIDDNYGDYDDDDVNTQPFNDCLGSQPQSQQAGLQYMGDNLIDRPEDLDTFLPNFAKFAKKMNVKRLKNAMWDVLTTEPIESPNASMQQLEPTKKMNLKVPFTDLYSTLPRKITPQMATDLSVPIAFVTLLHLCNEKGLQLIGQQDLENFEIEQQE